MIGVTHHSKVVRMVALIRFFEAGGEIGAPDLAEMAGISKRSANRLLNDVSLFVPLVESRPHRWRRMR